MGTRENVHYDICYYSRTERTVVRNLCSKRWSRK